ncbi:MAG: alpha/beta hydrolase [Candidatus Bipolaricaulis sp.]|nr:alpha/beta hydrolase [Candidatus Bipolaricaulis sp.]
MSPSTPPQVGFASSNGVRLHYLDWGGAGPVLVFLAGSGNTPHFFDSVARRLTDRFRVLGLTRRGHGESEQPESGYDIPTLARDIVGFLDALGIERASFAGHSYAGSEMVELAIRHPGRVERLVFLDALYEYEDSDIELFGSDPLQADGPPPDTFASVEEYSHDFVTRYSKYRRLRSPKWDALLAYALEPTADGRLRERLLPRAARQLGMAHFTYRVDWRAIGCPVLAIYASQDAEWSLPEGAPRELREAARAHAERMQREYVGRCVARARRDIRNLCILELRDATHYCFLDREDEVVDAMRRFL